MALVFFGGGSFANETYEYVHDSIEAGNLTGPVRGIVAPEPPNSALSRHCEYLGSEETADLASEDRAVVALSDPDLRYKIIKRLIERGMVYATIIHPTAYVASTAQIAEGCIIAPFVFVGPGAEIGAHSILNVHVTVGHDSGIGECCTLSPHAAVNGNAAIRNRVFLGSHAVVSPGCTVGFRTKISAGSVVTKDVGNGYLLHGNPAKGRVMFPDHSS